MHRVAGTLHARDLVQDTQQIIAQAVVMMEQAGRGDQVPRDQLPNDVPSYI